MLKYHNGGRCYELHFTVKNEMERDRFIVSINLPVNLKISYPSL